MKLSTKDFSEKSGVPIKTLRRWVSTGKLIPTERGEKGKSNFYDDFQIVVAQKLYSETKRANKSVDENTAVTAQDSPQASIDVADDILPVESENGEISAVNAKKSDVDTVMTSETVTAKKITVENAADGTNQLEKDQGDCNTSPQSTQEESINAARRRKISEILSTAQKNIGKIPEADRRGIEEDTFRHFKAGFSPNWRHSKAPNTIPTPRVIFPLGDGTVHAYNAILTNSGRERFANSDRWEFQKCLTDGGKFVFNPEALIKTSTVAVTEGEFDAVSIWQSVKKSGSKLVCDELVDICALGGTNGATKDLIERLNKLDRKPKLAIILFDGDDNHEDGKKPGRERAAELQKQFWEIGVVAVTGFFEDVLTDDEKASICKKDGDKPDANKILTTKGDKFLYRVFSRIVKKALEDFKQASTEMELWREHKQSANNSNDTAVQAASMKSNSQSKAENNPDIAALIDDINNTITPAMLEEKGYIRHSAKGNPRPNGYECNFCGSGTHKKKTGGLGFTQSAPTLFNCLACGESGNVIQFLAKVKGKENARGKEFIELLKEICDEFGISYDKKTFEYNETAAQIESLKAKLSEVEKAIDDFKREEKAALEKLRDVEKFDSDTVFADEIIKAAAFAYLSDRQVYSNFKRDLKIYGDKHKGEKVAVNDWLSDVRTCAGELQERYRDLLSKRNRIQARIESLSFFGDSDFEIPLQYSVSAKSGIKKIDGDKVIPVCLRPIVISERVYCVDENISKLVLSFMTMAGKWRRIPPTEKAIVFNRNRLIDLANDDLPVTSANAYNVTEYLNAFDVLNENNLPLSYFVNRGGWRSFNGKGYFVDPRRETIITNADGKNITVKVDTSCSEFAQHLKSKGSLESWKKAYLLAKKSPVARLMVAASVAPPLLMILGERNFLLYVYTLTRAGKTTALYLGTSAVGSHKINRSFDATKNGLAGAAAEVNDYVFPIDEKQVADNKISDQLTALVYALANGVGRTKLKRDSANMKIKDWRTIVIATGETLLLPDNVTGGANTRLMTVKAPKEILPAADCKIIRDTIQENYGLAFPLVVDKILQTDRKSLREMFDQMVATFDATVPETLPEHRRYMAVISLADALLNSALFGDTITMTDGNTLTPSDDAIINAVKIFPMIPTKAEISDTPKEKDFVRAFIGQNQTRFVGGDVDLEKMPKVYGKLNDADGFTYVVAQALKEACQKDGFDYRKLVADLVADGFFKPADKIEKGHKTALATVQKKIGVVNFRCHRIPKAKFEESE